LTLARRIQHDGAHRDAPPAPVRQH
jgi:hypothetical protein